MNRNKLFASAVNGLRSRYQTINSKATSTTTNNYTTIANENGNKIAGNYLNSYSPYYPKMVQNAYNSFEGHQQRFVGTGGKGMFAQKESAIEEQWIYNKDRELLKIIKKKLAAKDAMTFANQNQPAIPLNIAKSMNFNPALLRTHNGIILDNIFEEIIAEKKISLELYEGIEYVKATGKGICEKNNFFTPDGKKCYKCDNEDVGMIGCEGACNYSIKRNDILKCENKCKKGYIEIREGICEPCEIYNKGCYECHYENKYPKNYTKLKRKRRLVCDYCEEGFIQKEDK